MASPKLRKQSSGKISFRCNKCKEACSAKDGDWHPVAGSDSQQIFLCRDCERTTSGRSTSPRSLAPLY